MSLQEPTDSAWYMDSGATNHITAQPGTLNSVFNMSITPSVLVGDGSRAPVTQMGNAVLSSSPKKLFLKNVLVCPSIIKNLISVRQFVSENSCSIEFDPFGFTVKDLRTRINMLRCDSPGPLYSVTPSSSSSLPSVFLADSSLWHRRLGHPGSSINRSLHSLGFSNKNADLTTLCHACKMGKHARLPFFTLSTVVTEPFEIIHSDIWTSPVSSISGFKYYLLFMDHFSHYIWVYPLHRKSECFGKFLHFSTYVRNQFHKSIKAFQCDNGGEYTSRVFLDHLAANGIQLRFSCPHTSQQNGRAERMLRTINNLIRTLLIQSNMPYHFWVEALHTAAHTLNLLPSSSINNLVPFTRLFNKHVSYAHLRVFGCLCYPNTISTSSHKLAPRSMACVFLGYPANHRGYRCLNLATRKVIISRHVIFVEEVFPFSVFPTSPSASSPPPLPPSLSPPPIQRLISQTQPLVGNHSPPTPALTQNDHPMVTRSKNGITKTRVPLCLHTYIISPLPLSHVQAAKDPHWNESMGEEYNAHVKRGTWVLVPRPLHTNIIRSMWLYRQKFNADGTLKRHKSRLVANGKSQRPGIDCDETFSPVIKPASIRSVLHVALACGWQLRQLDVKNAFLHGDLEETVYMHQPPGFVDKSKPDHVCLLKRSIYGLKQAPRTWYTRFANIVKKIGFKQSRSDPSLFVLISGSTMAYILLYVDDIILTASTPALVQKIVDALSASLDISDLGRLHHFLGIGVTYNDTGLFLSQHNYVADILHRASMTNCKPSTTPVDTKSKLAVDEGPRVADPTLYRSLAGAL